MGDPPSPAHSLERIDTFGNYEPSNCKWLLRSEQAHNTRRTRWVEWKGERRKLFELCRELGLPLSAIGGRLNNGWSLDRALFTPIKKVPLRVSRVEHDIRRMADERVDRLMGEK